MTAQPKFAMNHMAAPRLDCRAFLDLAASLGCLGVELRNDLADKQLTDAAFFDGEAPAAIGNYARSKGLRLLGLSEVYGFNAWSDAMRAKVQLLIEQAKEAGAESISLIPRNDAPQYSDGGRDEALRRSLGEILPMLDAADLVALVEPLGFVTSSLRCKADAIAAIEAVGGSGRCKLVHDTFHHYLAGESEFFPEHTGIVHISGVIDPSLSPEEMQDSHRILVDERDRLGNIDQIRSLIDGGYSGAFSYEPFSRDIHRLSSAEEAFRLSMDFIRSTLS
ncbi:MULTISPECIES: TIM barrel protein [Mesorhizobium]|uniref:TIM barrel protein n=1 Tax=Mesorhizobium humile TaxID=3072313 RepID=A0ABU4YMC7_9HYPH|nr:MULTISPECIES: TIM barrel protein [unclassified Mesorhizobium]MDX8456796.1 TIM barrel protein [Mesorhizobium sp. VK9D]MDX8457296.1 TIM barrel protein [Mesorhizobium sp. VK2D]MDX8487089.1 TIM barrel protein [Mesorhizobium sp. VK2B]